MILYAKVVTIRGGGIQKQRPDQQFQDTQRSATRNLADASVLKSTLLFNGSNQEFTADEIVRTPIILLFSVIAIQSFTTWAGTSQTSNITFIFTLHFDL